MTITHTFVSGKSDSGDPTLVNPSNWNASHTIANSTITYAMLQNESAATILGNPTGSPAAPAEMTASQLFDMLQNTNGVLLTRNSGFWGAVGNVTVDGNDLLLKYNAAPGVPATGFAKPFGAELALRDMLGVQNSTAAPSLIVQPLFGQKAIGRWTAIANSATMSNDGLNAPTATGTATARTQASTSFATGMRRCGFVSAATVNSATGARLGSAQFWRGNAAQAGGFFFVTRFMISDASLVTTANMFVGLQASTVAPTDVAPSTLVNQLGVGCDSGDTVLQLYAAGSGAQTRTSLGASFPVNTVTTDLYELALYAPPNGSTVMYQVTHVNTGAVATGTISAGANLPSTTTFMTPQIWRSNGGTASAVAIDVTSLYTEVEY